MAERKRGAPLSGFMWGRTLVAGAWLFVQGTLVLTAGQRPDASFGFRMFNESTTLDVHLLREVDAPSGHGTVLIDAPRGEWVAEDAHGARHRFSVRDRIQEPALSTFDVVFHASYGGAAQIARLHAALDDVAAHLDGDTETRALVERITVRKNGREPYVETFRSARR